MPLLVRRRKWRLARRSWASQSSPLFVFLALTRFVQLPIESWSLESHIIPNTAHPIFFCDSLRPGGGDCRPSGRSQGHPLPDIGSLVARLSSIPHPKRILSTRRLLLEQGSWLVWSMVGCSYAAGLSIDWCRLRQFQYLTLYRHFVNL